MAATTPEGAARKSDLAGNDPRGRCEDAIDKLLRKRAAAIATSDDASGTGALRAATVGVLTRFREALRDELADPDSQLPADHEARLFAYLGKLSADRTAQAARRTGNGAGTSGADTDAEPTQPA